MESPAATDTVVYWIDRDDTIVRVNDAWSRFAEENEAPELAGERVLRRPLWSFVSDVTTRHLYMDLLRKVREGATVRFPLRCDSPAARRRLRMSVSAGGDGSVRFESLVASREGRAGQRLWARSTPRTSELIRVCGWCKRVDVSGEWREVEDALARLGLFEHDPLPGLTHGICERCAEDMQSAIDAAGSALGS